jgi:anaerobic selenocysteine-containing dehydrogenase
MATHYRTCPFCEATCGLEIETEGRTVVAVRGDSQDVFSRGFICPKAYGIKQLHEDPDRLTTPLIRRDGELVEASWDEAFEEIDRRLSPILAEHGRNSVGVYLGNPNAHNLSAILYAPALMRMLGSQNLYSASTVDQMPKQVSAGHMFGTMLSIPIPDVDRCDHLLLLGANPLVSNGSLLTAPDMRGRLRAIRERGGKVVVVDPRRTRTAEEADEHHFIRPGADALLLAAIACTLVEEGLDIASLSEGVAPRPAEPGASRTAGELARHVNGLDELRALVREFTPEAVAGPCGIEAGEIRRIARELAAAERGAVYARIGTCTQEFGTLASWLVDVLNVLTGNLDREGGAMFTRAAAGQRNSSGAGGTGKGVRFGRWASRVRGLPEAYGELPVAALAEEIDTPGEGQVRALITIAGNPLVSTPNSERLTRAVEGLEFMLAIDIYVNETTRHADVILPGPEPLEKSHYDIALYQLAARNVARYSPPVFERSMPPEWRTFLRLAGIVAGQGPHVDVDALDGVVVQTLIQRELSAPGSRVEGRDAGELMEALEPRRGPERIIDLMLRVGPYGDGFGTDPEGLTLDVLERSPHGIDLGPLEPRLPEVLRTPSGKVELMPEPIVADVERLRGALARERNGPTPNRAHSAEPSASGLVLIGRRQLRSNNSWMHNLPALVKGKDRCTLHIHPDDAERLGLVDGGRALVRSTAGEVEAPVELTDGIMPGVVSIPHGWGHSEDGVRLGVASAHAGVNSNVLADESLVDPLSGNAVLNGIPVHVAAAPIE